jgi:hypothetical protein
MLDSPTNESFKVSIHKTGPQATLGGNGSDLISHLEKMKTDSFQDDRVNNMPVENAENNTTEENQY